MSTRRDFIKTGGAFVVGFSLGERCVDKRQRPRRTWRLRVRSI
jgi:hypothetical protein